MDGGGGPGSAAVVKALSWPLCELDLMREHARFTANGILPDLNMKKMRCLFLVLALGFGLCAQRVQGQVSEQLMTFSIVCQYVTNSLTVTNSKTQVVTHNDSIQTVILNTGNVVKAVVLQKFGTNWMSWAPASILYEINLLTGNEGIYLRHAGIQTNISDLFGNSFTNMFSQNVNSVFIGTNSPTSLPLGGDLNDENPENVTNIDRFANLAYLTFSTSNIAFNLFGYSQGNIVHGSGYLDHVLYARYLPVGQVFGAGTFSLNLTTNIYRVTTPDGSPATNYTGVAHGSVYLGTAYFLPIGPPEGP
jgi:hypothetical protein